MPPPAKRPDMIDTVVVATDGSESVERCVDVALDLADHFGATVHALSIVDESEIEGSPEPLQADLERALTDSASDALAAVADRMDDEIETAVRTGDAAAEIVGYAEDVDADVVAMGTRGRHGEHRFLVGSVAERVVRTCPIPVLTVRQLEG